MATKTHRINHSNERQRKLVVQHTSGFSNEQYAKTWDLYKEIDAGWRYFWSKRGGAPSRFIA